MKNDIIDGFKNPKGFELVNPEYVSDVKIMGPLTTLTTFNGNFLPVSTNTCTSLFEENLSQQEVYEILSYLFDRYQSYIETLGHVVYSPSVCAETDKPLEVIGFEEGVISDMIKALISKYGYDMIVAALDAISDYQLFGVLNKDAYCDYESVVEEKIRYIQALVDVHTLYSNGNIDEIDYKYNQGRI